jgi:hypothetical protein
MAPPKQFISRKDIHVNIEEDIKDIGDLLGLMPKVVLKRGYFYSIDEHIERFGASAEVKEKWSRIKYRDAEEFNLKIQEEKNLEDAAKTEGARKKAEEEDKNRLIHVYNKITRSEEDIEERNFHPRMHERL